jgi:hypothetical protein
LAAAWRQSPRLASFGISGKSNGSQSVVWLLRLRQRAIRAAGPYSSLWRLGQGGVWFPRPRQCAHPCGQALQLVQDRAAPGLVIRGGTAHILQQLLVSTAHGVP